MRFSQEFDIEKDGTEDWFDLLLNQDTPLYVDPFLIFDDQDEFWSDAKQEIVNFFELAIGLSLKSGGENNQYWKSAINILKCPEPNQFCLGLSTGNPQGAGLGKLSAEKICKSLLKAKDSGISDFSMIPGFMTLVSGVGVDVVSDTICNILKKKFIEYTQKICEEYAIPMQDFFVRHAGFDGVRKTWNQGRFELPVNKHSNSYSLLVPKRFLSEIPAQDNGYHYYDAVDHNQQFRNQFNLKINEELSKSQRLAVVRAAMLDDPEKAMKFIKEFNRHNPNASYDFITDPDGLFNWYEDGIDLACSVDQIKEPQSRNIEEFVLELAQSFKHAVEEQGGWKHLWDEGYTKHRKEDIAQSLAGMMWRHQCKVADIDINREIETGRGPVDFKFSSGWQERALLEVKYLESNAFLNGLRKQTLQYLKSEEVSFGVYLVIQYEESVRMDQRIADIENEISHLKNEGKNLEVVFVNASPNKKSASKLK